MGYSLNLLLMLATILGGDAEQTLQRPMTCYFCVSGPSSHPLYDAKCSDPHYSGHSETHTSFDYAGCAVEVFDNGHVWRGYHLHESEPSCYHIDYEDNGTGTKCWCPGTKCNFDLCDDCWGDNTTSTTTAAATTPTTTQQPPSKEGVMSCYYANWAIYRTEGTLGIVEVEHITDLADVCTHLIYAYATLNRDSGEIQVSDGTADLCPGDEGGWPWSHCGYKDFTDLKYDHYSLKTLISVGGMDTTDIFSTMSADVTLRGNFVASVVPFLKKHNFDGLDMYWECPEGTADKANFVTLLSELEVALHEENLLLTAAVPVTKGLIDSGYDVPNISEHLDLIHVMAYDYHGAWNSTTHHNAPLYKHPSDLNDELTVDFSIHYWLELGAPADKLVLGLSMYGRCWALDDPDQHDVGAPGTVGPNGTYSRTPGQLFYTEICKSQKSNNNWTIVLDEDMEVPYGYCISWDNTWCGYDDEQSIANKAVYAHTLGLRGVMTWSVDQDDAHKECGEQSFPLTRKAWESFKNPLIKTSTIPVTPSTTAITSTETTPVTPTTTTTGLYCYNCIDCPMVDENTQVASEEDFLTCVTIMTSHETIIRSGGYDYHADGICYVDGSMTFCHCTTSLCNSFSADANDE